jgi:hypothetical protein
MACCVTRAALAAVVLAGTAALADVGQGSLRCGRMLVQVGVPKSAVVRECGPPTVRGPVRRLVTWLPSDYGWQEIVTHIESWRYDRGPNEFVRVLTFKDGGLATIELGNYGTP